MTDSQQMLEEPHSLTHNSNVKVELVHCRLVLIRYILMLQLKFEVFSFTLCVHNVCIGRNTNTMCLKCLYLVIF